MATTAFCNSIYVRAKFFSFEAFTVFELRQRGCLSCMIICEAVVCVIVQLDGIIL